MGNSFCGWYFRCQAQGESLALIPAVHCVGGVPVGLLTVYQRPGALERVLPRQPVPG